MITCTHCQSPQFLQIRRSMMLFEDRTDSDTLEKIEEHYICTFCGGEGEFIYQDGEGTLSGAVEEVSDPVIHL